MNDSERGVFGLILLFLLAMCSSGDGGGEGDNCYTDWDGRSNPTVCD